MNRLTELFQSKSTGILNVYFTAGYPTLESTGVIIHNLAEAGADLIEIGMPYSDPMADGETIQQSSMHALKNGMTLDVLFAQITAARQGTTIPLVLMGYYNQVLQYGPERFVAAAKAAGVDGLILPDLPIVEYEAEFRHLAEAQDLQVTFLITPQTSEERIRKIGAISTGFLYVVSSSSITGKSGEITPEQEAYFARVAALNLPQPRLIGFGISDARSFQKACAYANGAIIGSAFIRALKDTEDVAATTTAFVESILEPVL
ncbi:tryptophan synthase subunit alpha [Neolewinella lacunae]|uniref:Tryptophan synthase alpha chain n=1 Tax=Neolewinella lacunae TaxID=1517758 RepID=A0A923T9D4_9BACT|nr:tryptophan synthase subunit alpha [Neolewinella lacunae]MBC6995394.1 tryptophan synthase subunit alpha [Neolewinella lacunae]MDN3633106.1 tryptophan synthase subunit alpha [Neolewinella lacunae]